MINVYIDSLTNCLIRKNDSCTVSTYYTLLPRNFFTPQRVKLMHATGWTKNFNWSVVQKGGGMVFALYARNDDRVQGYIGIEHRLKDKYTYVVLAESSPWNVGKNGEYEGVGAHLFAIACKESWDAGNEGVVMFEPKTKLIDHYIKTLHADIIYRGVPARMMLDTPAAERLINQYLLKEGDEHES